MDNLVLSMVSLAINTALFYCLIWLADKSVEASGRIETLSARLAKLENHEVFKCSYCGLPKGHEGNCPEISKV